MSRHAATVWMPMYVADYLADTSHLSTEEHGAYLLLMMHAWQTGGALPDDDDRLRRITRLDARAWRRSGAVLRAFFRYVDGELRHPRVDEELTRAQALIAQRSTAGIASAAKRKEQRNAHEKSTGVDLPSPRQPAREGNPPPPQLPPIASVPTTSTDTAAAAQVCARLRAVGITGVNTHHPRLLAMLGAGYTADEIASIGEEEPSKGKSMAWVLGAAEGRRHDAATVKAVPPKKQEALPQGWWRSQEATKAAGIKLGLGEGKVGESLEAFQARIRKEVERIGRGDHQ